MKSASTCRYLTVLLFAATCAPAEAPAAVNARPSSFNIMDYGARNDGSSSATEAFRAAIQAAKKAGGGTVYVPAGKYESGPIELVSNLTLYFDAGATVYFPAVTLPF